MSKTQDQLLVVGPTLTLRYATLGDVEDLFELGSDPEVTRFFSWGPYTSLDQPRAYIESLLPKRESGDLLEFLVEHHEEGLIGVTGLCELARRDRRATVGTWFARKWWGTGVNLESKALVAALGFRYLGLDRLTAWANTTNGRSQSALERVGFTREGVLRSWHRHGKQVHDVVAFSMLRAEWRDSALSNVQVEVEGQLPEAFVVDKSLPSAKT